MTAKHRLFDVNDGDGTSSWWGEGRKYNSEEELLLAVDAFLTELGPERVIAVHHRNSQDFTFGSILVWYWNKEEYAR